MPKLRAVPALVALLVALGPAALAQSVITQSPDPAHEILSAPFQAETDVRSAARLTSGNVLELLQDGVNAFPRKHAMVATATSQVMVATMIWAHDATGRAFADALIARARAGVQVRVLLDGLYGDPRIVWKLRRGGVKVARYNPWLIGINGPNHRMHHKVVVADLARATAGGMNITDAYALANGTNARFHDVDLYVDGFAAVEVARRFLQVYTSVKRDDAAAAALLQGIDGRAQVPPAPAPGRDGYARAVWNQADEGHHHITDYYRRIVDAARRQVLIYVNHPLTSDPLLAAIKRAGARGVRVVIVSNSGLAYRARNGGFLGFLEDLWVDLYRRRHLRSAGIEVWEIDVPLHVKAVSVDGVVACVGSYNFSNSSIEKHAEQIVATHDPAIVRSLEGMFERDLARARRVQ